MNESRSSARRVRGHDDQVLRDVGAGRLGREPGRLRRPALVRVDVGHVDAEAPVEAPDVVGVERAVGDVARVDAPARISAPPTALGARSSVPIERSAIAAEPTAPRASLLAVTPPSRGVLSERTARRLMSRSLIERSLICALPISRAAWAGPPRATNSATSASTVARDGRRTIISVGSQPDDQTSLNGCTRAKRSARPHRRAGRARRSARRRPAARRACPARPPRRRRARRSGRPRARSRAGGR